jgi:hypothetical protein
MNGNQRPPPVWTSRRVADRLATLARQRGVPNSFHLHEISGFSSGRGDTLAISRVARTETLDLNRVLAESHLRASYRIRTSTDPACLWVESL